MVVFKFPRVSRCRVATLNFLICYMRQTGFFCSNKIYETKFINVFCVYRTLYRIKNFEYFCI